MYVFLPVVYRPQILVNGKTVKGIAQNHVNATMTAACEPFSLPSIGAEIVLVTKKIVMKFKKF